MRVKIPGKHISANEMFYKWTNPTTAYKAWLTFFREYWPEEIKLESGKEYELKIWVGTLSVCDADNAIKPIQDSIQKVMRERFPEEKFNDSSIFKVSAEKEVVKNKDRYIMIEVLPYIKQGVPIPNITLPPFEKPTKKVRKK